VEHNASDRERFCAQLYTTPIMKADAVVVLCGEDTAARLATGVELVNTRCAPLLVLSGGRHEPPHIRSAPDLVADALGMGVAADHIIVEDGSQHTAAQAANVLDMAEANGWKRLLLVCSAYHAPRAMLTFIRRAQQMKHDIHFIAVPAVGHWHGPIDAQTRLQKLDTEFTKIAAYQRTRDCATYESALNYLKRTEGK